MNAKSEAMFVRGGEYGACFFYGKGVVVTEDIAIFRDTQFGDFGDEFFGDELDVVRTAVFVFRRDGVGGEQSGNDVRRAFVVEAANHAEHFEFGFTVEAVAGFGF